VFYHAWTVQQPGRTRRCTGGGRLQRGLDRQELGCQSTSVELYRDFIFISFNRQLKTSVDYLAGASNISI